MSDLHQSAVGDLARGGQTTLLSYRMLGEVFGKFAGLIPTVTLLSAVGLFWWQTPEIDRYLGMRFVGAELACGMGPKNCAATTAINIPGRGQSPAIYSSIKSAPGMIALAHVLTRRATEDLVYGFFAGLGMFALACYLMMRSGKKQRVEKRIRGARIVEAKALRHWLKVRRKASTLPVAGVPMLKDSETSHTVIIGSPGTGKSTTIHELMTAIRDRGDRCICFSPSGDFIEWFYREKRDVILNPFDERCPDWDLWGECEHDYHYDMMAAAFIPEGRDPFWSGASRVLLSSLARVMKERGDASIAGLIKWISEAELPVLHAYLAGTEASALMNPDTEKTAGGIRTNAAAYARSLRYLPAGEVSFGIRDWVRNKEDDGSWVFLNARSDQLDSVRPLLSAWLETLTNALMSLPASRTRRVWLILDELPSLNKIPSLAPFLAQARKYGGCGVIAFQQVSQLRSVYGRDGADDLTGLCATWVTLRQNDPDSAQWVAKSFGDAEYAEQQEGVQYGSSEMRDGVSLSTQRKTRHLLLPSEIQALNDLEGYVRLPGDSPVAHFKMKPGKMSRQAPAFVPRPMARAATPDAEADPLAGLAVDNLFMMAFDEG